MVRDTVDRVHELPNMVTVYTAETTEPKKHPSLQFALETNWYGTSTKDAEPFIEFKCVDGLLETEKIVRGQSIVGTSFTGQPFDVKFGLSAANQLIIHIPDDHPLKAFETKKKITFKDVFNYYWRKLWGMT